MQFPVGNDIYFVQRISEDFICLEAFSRATFIRLLCIAPPLKSPPQRKLKTFKYTFWIQKDIRVISPI